MRLNRVLLTGVCCAALAIFAQVEQVSARLFQPAPAPAAAPAPAPAPAPAAAPAPVATPAPVVSADCCTPQPCCPKPCITYRHHGPKLCCDCCLPSTPTVLKVANPCTGCEADVEVCLPGCCTGEPKVCCGSGFLGRNIVEYEWCCGYRVRVAFKHSGDLLVSTWGR